MVSEAVETFHHTLVAADVFHQPIHSALTRRRIGIRQQIDELRKALLANLLIIRRTIGKIITAPEILEHILQSRLSVGHHSRHLRERKLNILCANTHRCQHTSHRNNYASHTYHNAHKVTAKSRNSEIFNLFLAQKAKEEEKEGRIVYRLGLRV